MTVDVSYVLISVVIFMTWICLYVNHCRIAALEDSRRKELEDTPKDYSVFPETPKTRTQWDLPDPPRRKS